MEKSGMVWSQLRCVGSILAAAFLIVAGCDDTADEPGGLTGSDDAATADTGFADSTSPDGGGTDADATGSDGADIDDAAGGPDGDAGDGQFDSDSTAPDGGHTGSDADGGGDGVDAAPEFPIGATLQVTVLGPSALRIGWPAAQDDDAVASYQVDVAGTVSSVTGTEHGFVATGLTAETNYALTVTAVDGAGQSSSTLSGSGTTAAVPLDPATLAPAFPETGFLSFYDETAFLWNGDPAIQVGVTTGTISPVDAAGVQGRLIERSGEPIVGARVEVEGHAEYGHTLTDGEGRFRLIVNRGGQLTLSMSGSGLLESQRAVLPRAETWRDIGTVALVALDANATVVSLNDMLAPQIARGTPVTDADGTRQATMMFRPGTSASMKMPDGTSAALDTLTVRATEYTVGDNGPAAMPGELPPTSGYTYAVELSVDEAMAAGATTVEFSKPVPLYVENFLGFPVGLDVPLGYYDREVQAWLPAPDGRVIAVISEAAGLAELDVTGDGVADAVAVLEALGIDDVERETIATLYEPGDELWRSPVTHFTPWDCNWPFGPPEDAEKPLLEQLQEWLDENCTIGGSIISCEAQALGEQLGITGVPFKLHYDSARVDGREQNRLLRMQLTGDSVPESMTGVLLTVQVDGQIQIFTFEPEPNLEYLYEFNGLDAFGRDVRGRRQVNWRVDYVYPGVYYEPGDFEASFGTVSGAPISSVPSRQEVLIGQEFSGYVGSIDVKAQGLGGWSITPHHAYDPYAKELYLGDGTRTSAELVGNTISPLIGFDTDTVNGALLAAALEASGITDLFGDGPATYSLLVQPKALASMPSGEVVVGEFARVRRLNGDQLETLAGSPSLFPPCLPGAGECDAKDGGPAAEAVIGQVVDLEVDADGNIYFLDGSFQTIRRISPDGVIERIAGIGSAAECSLGQLDCSGAFEEGIPALDALLGNPKALALAADGTIYVAQGVSELDGPDKVVRAIDPDGIIRTIAGGATIGSPADAGGKPALEARLFGPTALEMGPDGLLYIADDRRVFRLSAAGILELVADHNGSGCPSTDSVCLGDGGSPLDAVFTAIVDLAFAPDGALYIADDGRNRVRVIGPDGSIGTAVGTGESGSAGDGGPAGGAALNQLRAIHTMPDGALIVADTARVRIVKPSLPGYGLELLQVASPGADAIHLFSQSGTHEATVSTNTGEALWTFQHDADGRLTGATDLAGTTTTFARDDGGALQSLTAPDGAVTTFTLDDDGYLSAMTNPAGDSITMSYGDGGLLTELTDLRGNAWTFAYDTAGLLLSDENPAGGTKLLARENTANGHRVTYTETTGETRKYTVARFSTLIARSFTNEAGGVSSVEQLPHLGVTRSTELNGNEVYQRTVGDPRFGSQAPYPREFTVTTPGGIHSEERRVRTVTWVDPLEPTELATWTETITRNDDVYTAEYDAVAGTLTTTSPEARQVVETVDGLGREVSRQVGDKAALTTTWNAEGRIGSMSRGTRTVSFTYDGTGHVDQVTLPNGGVTRYTRNAAGHIVSETRADDRVELRTVDEGGNMLTVERPDGTTHAMTWTVLGNLASWTPPNTGDNAVMTVSHDTAGRTTGAVWTGGETLTRGYTNGWLTSVSSTLTDGTGSSAYGLTWDSAGQVIGQSLPDGSTLAVTYDGDIVTSQTVTGAFSATLLRSVDAHRRVTSHASGGLSVAYGYDGDGLPISAGPATVLRAEQSPEPTLVSVGEVDVAYVYDEYGAVTRILATTGAAGSTILFDQQTTHDAMGFVASETTTTAAGTVADAYSYDSVGRLVTHVKGGVETSFAYDVRDNLVGIGGLTQTVDARDRVVGSGEANLGWSISGHRTSRDTTSYTYDLLGNLASVSLPGGSTIAYTHDLAGRRIAKRVDGALVGGWLWRDGLRPLARVDASGTVDMMFVYGARPNVPDAIITAGATYVVVSDARGSVRMVIDATTGAVVQELTYDAYGAVLSDTAPGFQPFGFMGGLYDPATGLVRLGARDYDPATGQWMSPDPSGFDGGYNHYAFAGGNPVSLVDITGREPITLTAIAIGAGVAVGFDLASQYFFGEGGYNWCKTLLAAGGGALGVATGGGSLASQLISGGLIDGGSQVASNFIDGKPLGDGVVTNVLAGGLAGQAGQGLQAIAGAPGTSAAFSSQFQSTLNGLGHAVGGSGGFYAAPWGN